jgi:hypothetical protein
MKNTRVIFTLFMTLCLLTKVYFISIDNPGLKFSDDDQRNYDIAQNYVSGKGYGIYDPMTNRYRLSAYHTSSTVFLYQFLINNKVSHKTIAIVFYALSTILYLLAIAYVYRILTLLGVVPAIVYCATAVFAFYPSVLYAIGTMYHFDNLIMPLYIINTYYLLKWIKGRTLALPEYAFLIASITCCCFFRTQVLLLYFFTGCFLFTLYVSQSAKASAVRRQRLCRRRAGEEDRIRSKQPNNALLYFLSILAVTVSIAYIPTLQKNKRLFGTYFISTQAGFELLNGHNGITGGNWRITTPGSALDRYVHEKIPGIDTLDEYAESKAREQLAREWIRQNPGMEAKYIFKKMARYFMPENGNAYRIKPVFKYHPLTILVHLIFLTGFITALLKDRKSLVTDTTILLLIPVGVTLLLSVVFFFDFKLRYYAEPCMIILAACMTNHFIKLKKFPAFFSVFKIIF